MSHSYNESEIKLNIVKQKVITSLLHNNYDLVSMCFARVYTADSKSGSWLYSALEGALCLVIDYPRKWARFIMFDLLTLEITFENEFYKNFSVFYTFLSETFQYFEVAGGFIGFQILDQNSAKNFFKSVTSLSDQVIINKVKEFKIRNSNEIKKSGINNLNLLKKKLNGEYFFKDNPSNQEKIIFNLNRIEKLLEMIEFDSISQNFLVDGNSKEIEELLKANSVKNERIGLQIGDRKAYAMEIYKNMINTNKVANIEQNSIKLEENKTKLNTKNKIDNNQKVTKPNVPEVSQTQKMEVTKTAPKGPIPPKIPTAPIIAKVPQIPQVKSKIQIVSEYIVDSTAVEKKMIDNIPIKEISAKKPEKTDMISELRSKLANRASKLNNLNNEIENQPLNLKNENNFGLKKNLDSDLIQNNLNIVNKFEKKDVSNKRINDLN